MPSNNAHTWLELPPSSNVDAGFQTSLNDSLRQIALQLDSISTGKGSKGTGSGGSTTVATGHSGGQYSIQVSGYLAIESDAAPPLIVDTTQNPVDCTAYVNLAPQGGPVVCRVLQGTTVFATLTIPAGATQSNTVKGLAQLTVGSILSLNITNVPGSGSMQPGKDLTVVIRL
jgi:hypothetical protein